MPEDDVPQGQLFSRLYLERGQLAQDSERFRRRLEAYFDDHLGFLVSVRSDSKSFLELLKGLIYIQLGVDVHGVYNRWHPLGNFFRRAELRDIIDVITLTWRLLMEHREQKRAEHFVWFVGVVFAEENLGYRIDARGD